MPLHCPFLLCLETQMKWLEVQQPSWTGRPPEGWRPCTRAGVPLMLRSNNTGPRRLPSELLHERNKLLCCVSLLLVVASNSELIQLLASKIIRIHILKKSEF